MRQQMRCPSPRIQLRRVLLTSTMAAALILGGCSGRDDQARTSPTEPSIGAVTDIAAAVLPSVPMDSDGHLVLNPPSERFPILSSSQAQDLAVAYLKLNGRDLSPTIQRDRGEPTDLQEVQPSQVTYAHSPYRTGDAEAPLRNPWGPYYLVFFNDADGVRVLSVAVSAHATYLSVGTDGQVVEPKAHSTEFFTVGIPASDQVRSPEAAVGLVASVLGRKISQTPRFVRRGRRWAPQEGLWELRLDEPVGLLLGGRETTSDHLFVNRRGELFIASPNQPREELMSGKGRAVSPIRVRDGAKIDFDRVGPR